jgi:DNA-binding GntR family transcriptional regulator
MSLPVAETVTRSEAAAAHIRREIIQGIRAPGSPLREADLCATLGLSRATVREALRRLQDQGIVEVFPHRGAYVARMSSRTAREVHTLRALLEPFAVGLAVAERAYSEKVLSELEALADELAATDRQGDAVQALQLDAEFHLRLSEPCGHQLVISALRGLHSKTAVYLLHVKLLGRGLDQTPTPHRKIVEAVRSGDPALAEEAVRAHINEGANLVVQQLLAREAQESG